MINKRLITVLLGVIAVIMLFSGCATQTQRQSAYSAVKMSELFLQVSARRYQRCVQGFILVDPKFDSCSLEHQARVDAYNEAHPFVMASTSAAMAAPNEPADSNLQRARQILIQFSAGLMAVAEDSELQELEWLDET